MNKVILKHLAILGLLIGAVLGILAAIPYVGGFALFAVLFLASPVVMLLLIMAGKYDLTTPKDSIINGALIGFFCNITFSFAYCIVTAILYLAIKFTTNLFLTVMIINSPVWLLILVVLFTGVLTATTNAFSGFLTYYIINLIRDLYAKKNISKER